MSKTIGVFVGSLRKESFSKKLANEMIKMAPEGYNFKIIPIGDLPLYNQDYDDENNAPEAYGVFRKAVGEVDAFLFVTPEYNRSVPAVLKNALDVGSRPYGSSVWSGKPGMVVSDSPGNIAGFGANHHLRQSLVFLHVLTMQQPEMYLGNIAAVLDDSGKITDENTKSFVQDGVNAFVDWIEKVS